MHEVEMDADGEWDVSDKQPSQNTDVRLSLKVDVTVIRIKCDKYSTGRFTVSVDVFKLVLDILNPLAGQQKLLMCANSLHAYFGLSDKQIQSLERQISAHPVEMKSVASEVNCLVAGPTAAHVQFANV